MGRQGINNTVYEQELQEIRALSDWAKLHRKEQGGRERSLRSDDLGGHMELREEDPHDLIVPSEKRVQELLADCGTRLGIHYVCR